MITINIAIDDQNVLGVIAKLQQRLVNMLPAMKQSGDVLVGTTKRRFATSTSPDGVPWAPDSMTTYLRMIERAHGATLTRGKDAGRVNAKGIGMAAGKRPLIGETRHLRDHIFPQASADSVLIGSPEIYSAVQQFGEKKGAAGHDRRNHPIPWGDIPARPFIGMSVADDDAVLSIVARFLQTGLAG